MKFIFSIIFISVLSIFSSCKSEEKKAEPSAAKIDSLPNNPYTQLDKSPMDMAWLPDNYPVEKMQGNDSLKLIARITYSRPHKKGRLIFGNDPKCLCPYGKPWRLGANEATEIIFFENVSIGGKNIDKGMYVMYCIPEQDHWTIILNSNLYTWGLHIDPKKDLFKTEIPVSEQSPGVEDFTMKFSESPTGADLTMAWDNVKAVLPITFAK